MKRKGLAWLAMLLLIALFLGCSQNFDQVQEVSAVDRAATDPVIIAKIIKDVGVIRYIDLEGGFYGIIGKTGNYDPINLPKEFQKSGLRVKFVAEIAIVNSIHMWGTPIKLISILSTNTKPTLIMDSGVLHQKMIQGGPWIVEATTNTYQLLKLPDEFMVENLNVLFVGIIRTDIIIIPALWPLVEITSIEKLPGSPVIVNLKEEFKLPVKATASIPRAGILFTFKSVLQDSRCPTGVECFWAGEAVILVNIVIRGVDYGDYKLSTYPVSASNIVTVGGYSFQFNDLWPYPVYKSPIDPKSYVGYFIIYPALSISAES